MHRVIKLAGSLLAGVLAFLVVGIGVTAALAPYVWPSLLLGLPAGIAAGIAVAPLAYLLVTYWEGRPPSGSTPQ
ncbi:MAG: hypothetical protein ACI8XM_000160 [Haloarculaceae archaeon]|jgi:hypothetical protein